MGHVVREIYLTILVNSLIRERDRVPPLALSTLFGISGRRRSWIVNSFYMIRQDGTYGKSNIS
jgi:hypothetical protein